MLVTIGTKRVKKDDILVTHDKWKYLCCLA